MSDVPLGVVSYHIMQVEVAMKRKITAAFAEHGHPVTFEQWSLLNRICETPGLIQSELAARSFKDKTNVTRILDVLEKNGYIERRASGKDRRSLQVYLTDQGHGVMQALRPLAFAVNRRFIQGIDQAEMDTFFKVLSAILRNVEAL